MLPVRDAAGRTGGACPWCLGKGRRPYRHVLRLAPYREPLRGLIHRMKYQRQWRLAEELGHRLGRKRAVLDLLARADCLLPVPLHRLRQTGRGYNQAQMIAAALSRQARQAAGRRVPVVHPLVRLVHTDTQTHIHSPHKREENLAGRSG